MKVKISNQIFDSNDEPIMLILDSTDKENISNMTEDATKYCSFPDGESFKNVREFMKTE